MIKQKTIGSDARLEGIGLHLGKHTKICIKPAPPNHGIVFKRVDLPDSLPIPADIDYVEKGLERETCIGRDGVMIYSIEHIMASFAGMEIDNALVEVDGEEIPRCDGNAIPFVNAIKESGIVEQSAPRRFICIDEPILYENDNNVALSVFPSDRFRLTLMVDFNHPAIGAQHTTLFDMSEFEKEYAPARTFCFLSEVLELRKSGIIKGGSLTSALVAQDMEKNEDHLGKVKELFGKGEEIHWGENGFLNDPTLRYDNEVCRHKALDLMGDLYMLGAPLKAHVLGARTGHTANIEMARRIRKQYDKKKPVDDKEFGINRILEILPHRYPFLLVDKVLDIVPKKRITAIKNVSINEPYFQGHFPEFPVMPGVLQIEALAQAGGLLALSAMEEKHAQVVYFMGIDKAKFRRPVMPGDQIRLVVDVIRMKGKIVKLAGKAYVGDDIACEAELMATISDKR